MQQHTSHHEIKRGAKRGLALPHLPCPRPLAANTYWFVFLYSCSRCSTSTPLILTSRRKSSTVLYWYKCVFAQNGTRRIRARTAASSWRIKYSHTSLQVPRRLIALDRHLLSLRLLLNDKVLLNYEVLSKYISLGSKISTSVRFTSADLSLSSSRST